MIYTIFKIQLEIDYKFYIEHMLIYFDGYNIN